MEQKIFDFTRGPEPVVTIGKREYFDNKFQVWFTIGNQTFYLDPVDDEESANAYVLMLGAAMAKAIHGESKA